MTASGLAMLLLVIGAGLLLNLYVLCRLILVSRRRRKAARAGASRSARRGSAER